MTTIPTRDMVLDALRSVNTTGWEDWELKEVQRLVSQQALASNRIDIEKLERNRAITELRDHGVIGDIVCKREHTSFGIRLRCIGLSPRGEHTRMDNVRPTISAQDLLLYNVDLLKKEVERHRTSWQGDHSHMPVMFHVADLLRLIADLEQIAEAEVPGVVTLHYTKYPVAEKVLQDRELPHIDWSSIAHQQLLAELRDAAPHAPQEIVVKTERHDTPS